MSFAVFRSFPSALCSKEECPWLHSCSWQWGGPAHNGTCKTGSGNVPSCVCLGSFRVRVCHGTRANQMRSVTSSSLTPCFRQELLTREQTFLCVALDLYIQLLRLFVEGKDLPQAEQAGQSPDPTEHVSEAPSLFPSCESCSLSLPLPRAASLLFPPSCTKQR